jgi:hypothetical protein
VPGPARPPRPAPGAHPLLHLGAGYRHLTTQINLAGDKYLWDDFAYATRDGLVGEITFREDGARGVAGRYAECSSISSCRRPRAATPNSAAGGRGLCNRPEASQRSSRVARSQVTADLWERVYPEKNIKTRAGHKARPNPPCEKSHENPVQGLLPVRRRGRLHRHADFLCRPAGDHFPRRRSRRPVPGQLSSWVWAVSMGSAVLGAC